MRKISLSLSFCLFIFIFIACLPPDPKKGDKLRFSSNSDIWINLCVDDSYCNEGEVCYESICYEQCKNNDECRKYQNPCRNVKNLAVKICHLCRETADCFSTETCLKNICRKNCKDNSYCKEKEICFNQICQPKPVEPVPEKAEETASDTETATEVSQDTEPLTKEVVADDGGQPEFQPEQVVDDGGQPEKVADAPQCRQGETRVCYTGSTGCIKQANGAYSCKGTCAKGSQPCTNQGTWSNVCLGQVLPTAEICDNQDNDCNGLVDDDPKCRSEIEAEKTPDDGGPTEQPAEAVFEKIPEPQPEPHPEPQPESQPEPQPESQPDYQCPPASARPCYTAGYGCTKRSGGGYDCIGTCQSGQETCNAQGQWSGICVGQVKPTAEICDNQDNNCNGLVDDTLNNCAYTEIFIKAGVFSQGSPATEKGRTNEETQHTVTLTNDFAVFKYEVTQYVYQTIIGTNPSLNTGCAQCPVENISWHDAASFCNKLSTKAGLEQCYQCAPGVCTPQPQFVGQNYYTCKGYRLPTSAEWEYAARAGSTAAFYNGDITQLNGLDPNLDKIAWFQANSGGKTKTFGTKAANAWGLHDTLGNVWEWVFDWYDFYTSANQINPTGPASGQLKVLRGGAYNEYSSECRNASLMSLGPANHQSYTGVRPVRTF